jgi:heme A synthase
MFLKILVIALGSVLAAQGFMGQLTPFQGALGWLTVVFSSAVDLYLNSKLAARKDKKDE